MFAIMGITGQVGSAVARTLLAGGHTIRAVVRDPAKGTQWARLGGEVAVADFLDGGAMRAALEGVEGVFVMVPPYFTPRPGFPEAREVISVLHDTIVSAAPPKVVCLSSIGAHRESGLGLITQLHILEQEFGRLGVPTAFIRAGWFMENARWDVEAARETGEISSFLHPLDRPVPMVATNDVGRVAAETLLGRWTGRRVVELEGPRRYSPNDLAAAFSDSLGRPVRAVAVPRDRWATILGGADSAAPRMEMLDGFNSGWIDYERGNGCEHVLGTVTLDEAVFDLATTTASA